VLQIIERKGYEYMKRRLLHNVKNLCLRTGAEIFKNKCDDKLVRVPKYCAFEAYGGMEVNAQFF
jgi:hypothetical protein